ncbi:helix-turn-helix domain-containing protein [Fulvimonas soli]|jgi:CRP/FNR family transcriptional regulator|uniref:CRP-like protein Clp n=1 Tax=Fulvimonas soli TaxID=155197 RepID=A0A316I004_9GAMM|nr:helix-turn-helix domain-containing protein [Fulvimonas soli]PWK85783.1 CRP/FNR family transcriptional regulator [Fulvimonas soli]TNY25728.1 transcriptional regulator [Fulvimonas soli]
MRPRNPAGRLPEPPSPIADDGDESHFCRTCAFAGACLAVGYGKPELSALHCLVEHVGPYRAGEHIFRTGDPFRAIFAVRAGTVKTCLVDKDGREQVLGFYLPGEVIGLNAIYPDHFPCDAVALETAYFCRFSFPAMSALAARMPAVQQHLFRLLSKELGAASLLAGDHSADERMAAFLVDLGERYASRGFSGTQFQLSMSRGDIANYLRLAAETVSRVLGRFRAQGLIEIEGRALTLRDAAGLRRIGQSLLPE